MAENSTESTSATAAAEAKTILEAAEKKAQEILEKVGAAERKAEEILRKAEAERAVCVCLWPCIRVSVYFL